ncbi:response regulator [Guggenheimella bovis]
MIRTVIVDDDELIRESLSLLINGKESIEVVGTGKNGYDAIKLSEKADVILLDLRMPEMGGLEALRRLKDKKVLILTTFDDDDEISEALSLGAKGYLQKSSSPKSIINAIVEIYGGKSVYDEVAMNVLKGGLKPKRSHQVTLSDRELQVAEKISQGLSNKEIAEELFISEGTVKNYITSVLQKTGLEHRTQIAISYLKGEI